MNTYELSLSTPGYTARRITNNRNGHPRYVVRFIAGLSYPEKSRRVYGVISHTFGLGRYSEAQEGYIVTTYDNIDNVAEKAIDSYINRGGL